MRSTNLRLNILIFSLCLVSSILFVSLNILYSFLYHTIFFSIGKYFLQYFLVSLKKMNGTRENAHTRAYLNHLHSAF